MTSYKKNSDGLGTTQNFQQQNESYTFKNGRKLFESDISMNHSRFAKYIVLISVVKIIAKFEKKIRIRFDQI